MLVSSLVISLHRTVGSIRLKGILQNVPVYRVAKQRCTPEPSGFTDMSDQGDKIGELREEPVAIYLAPGQHCIEYRIPDGGAYRKLVTVLQGVNQDYEHSLAPPLPEKEVLEPFWGTSERDNAYDRCMATSNEEGGLARECLRVAVAYMKLPSENPIRAKMALSRGCDLGSRPSCEMRGWLARHIDDDKRWTGYYKQACAKSNPMPCYRSHLKAPDDRTLPPVSRYDFGVKLNGFPVQDALLYTPWVGVRGVGYQSSSDQSFNYGLGLELDLPPGIVPYLDKVLASKYHAFTIGVAPRFQWRRCSRSGDCGVQVFIPLSVKLKTVWQQRGTIDVEYEFNNIDDDRHVLGLAMGWRFGSWMVKGGVQAPLGRDSDVRYFLGVGPVMGPMLNWLSDRMRR